MNELLERRARLRLLWSAATWSDAQLFTVIEVLGEHVERPRGMHHDASRVLWVRDDFVAETGRDLYRYWVNEMFEEADVPFRMATTGDDVGRVVRFEGSAEQELMDEMAGRSSGVDVAAVSHAIATYRKRAAIRQDKEVAIVELGGVLELRRRAILEPNLTKGELALFGVLNNFALRHKREDQITDYDEAVLDWIFIWCLSTVRLLDRLIARGAP